MVVAILLAVGAYFYPSVKNVPALFGSTSCGSITCLSGGLRLVTDAGGDFESDVAAIFGAAVTFNGNVTVTTSNIATSSLAAGCFQTTATSTATPIRFVIGQANFAATTTFGGVNGGFPVLAQFGTCPH